VLSACYELCAAALCAREASPCATAIFGSNLWPPDLAQKPPSVQIIGKKSMRHDYRPATPCVAPWNKSKASTHGAACLLHSPR
jgi:hypothetical protein